MPNIDELLQDVRTTKSAFLAAVDRLERALDPHEVAIRTLPPIDGSLLRTCAHGFLDDGTCTAGFLDDHIAHPIAYTVEPSL